MNCEDCPYDDYERRINRYTRLHTTEDPDWQPEYLWCDKVGGEHLQFGYCDECDESPPNNFKPNKRKQPGRALRRFNTVNKEKRLRKIIDYGYAPHRGYLGYDFVDGEWIDGNHIKFPARSNTQKWIKRLTSKKVRKAKDVPHHNGYRRYVDYWWTMY